MATDMGTNNVGTPHPGFDIPIHSTDMGTNHATDMGTNNVGSPACGYSEWLSGQETQRHE
jgi:hypothetical protein